MNERSATRSDLRTDGPTMTVTEVAEYLNVHRITIYRHLKADAGFGQFKVGRVWRFSREAIVRFANGETTQQ
jgi:excisionase family DNA binding protein